ncbi:MAG TPA: hypothetical protein VHV82_08775 [Sporichthyaceae bacterium]|jgi:hypothetical protein|nr:hypothetical protein [Sporichthyaceae bacterium]
MRRTAAGGALFCTGFALGAFGANFPGHHEQPPAVVSMLLRNTAHTPVAGPLRPVYKPLAASGRILAAAVTTGRPPARDAVASSAPPTGTPAPAPASGLSAAPAGPGPGNITGIDVSLNVLGLLAGVAGPICNLDENPNAPTVDRTFAPIGIDTCRSLRQFTALTPGRQASGDRTVSGANVPRTSN